MGPMKKIAVVGLGSIGQRHVRNLLMLGITDLTVVRQRKHPISDPNILRTVLVCDELETCLQSKPDAVIIANPTSLHMSAAIMAAENGCHLFIEKPLSHDLHGLDQLEKIIQLRGLICHIGYQMRFHPSLLQIRNVLLEGKIGKVLSVRAEVGQYLPEWHPGEDYRTSYSSSHALGGGVLLDLSHEIDYINWLFGPVRRVCCMMGKYSSLEIETEDTVEILMQCEGAPIVEIHLDYVQRAPSRTCQIIGSEGTIRWDYHKNRVSVHSAKVNAIETYICKSFERNQMYLAEMSHFLKCLVDLERPAVTFAEGRKVLEIALMARLASQTSRTCDMSSISEVLT